MQFGCERGSGAGAPLLPSRQGSSGAEPPADTEEAMDAAPAHELHGRGAPRLLAHFAAVERLIAPEGPSGRLRLEREVGWELAQLLVAGLSRAGSRKPEPVPA